METSIKINTDNLGPEVLEAIKKMFPHKDVEITVQYADETEYILSNKSYANELAERIAGYRKTGELILVNPDDLP